MNDIIRNLTNEERSALFAVALDQADSLGVGFEEVIGEVVRAYAEEKMRKERETTPVEEPIDIPEDIEEEVVKEEEEVVDIPEDTFTDIEPTPEPVVDFPEDFEFPTLYDDDTMRDLLVSQYEEVGEAVKEGYESIDRRDYNLGGMISDAKSGRIIDEDLYFKTHTGYTPIKQQFKELIDKINKGMRGAYYAHLVHSGDDVIDAEKQEAIERYQELYDKGLEVESTVTEEDWEKHSAATISFEQLESMYTKAGVLRVGVEGRNARRNPSDINEFDPLCCDNEYETARNILDPGDRSFFNHRITDEAKAFVQSTIEKLKSMTSKEYREHKLAQMHLSSTEKEYYDEKWMQNGNDFHDEAFEAPERHR